MIALIAEVLAKLACTRREFAKEKKLHLAFVEQRMADGGYILDWCWSLMLKSLSSGRFLEVVREKSLQNKRLIIHLLSEQNGDDFASGPKLGIECSTAGIPRPF